MSFPPVSSMSSWKDAFSQGRNAKRNTFLGIAGIFAIFTFLSGEKSQFLMVPLCLIIAYLFSARLEWRWEIPARVKRGMSVSLRIQAKNKAFKFLTFKGDALHDIFFEVETSPMLSVTGKANKSINSLDAGEETSMEFQLKTAFDATPDLYGILIESACSAGRKEKYVEIYVYEEE